MYVEPPMKLVSHKFRNVDTLHLYRRDKLNKTLAKVYNRKRKHTSADVAQISTGKKRYLSRTDPNNTTYVINSPARNECIPTLYHFGPTCFKENFDLEIPNYDLL